MNMLVNEPPEYSQVELENFRNFTSDMNCVKTAVATKN